MEIKAITERKNKKMDSMLTNYQKDMIDKNIYSLTMSEEFMEKFSKLDPNAKEYAFDLYSGWDNISALSLEDGKYIEEMMKNPNIRLGIHRSDTIDGNDLFNDPTLKKIIDEGLIVLGDASSGSVRLNPSPNKTLTIGGSLLSMMINLKSSYKESNSVIIAAIPAHCTDDEGDLINNSETELYDIRNGASYLKPEYIVGVLTQTFNEELCQFYPIDDLKNKLSISNKAL